MKSNYKFQEAFMKVKNPDTIEIEDRTSRLDFVVWVNILNCWVTWKELFSTMSSKPDFDHSFKTKSE